MKGNVCHTIMWWLLGLTFALGGVVHADVGADAIAQYGLYPDYATTFRVQSIGNRLKLAAGLPDVTFQILNSDDLNAFALPDGRIFITSRLATEVTDDELAFVLGHELIHVRDKHAVHQNKKTATATILTVILVSAAGGTQGQVSDAANIGGALAAGHYSREDENHADDGGVRLMAAIGYDPTKAADTMQRLIDAYGRGDAGIPVIGWFADHPDTQYRKKHTLAVAAELKATPPTMLAPALGVTIGLDASAVHAANWAPDYLALLLTAAGDGRIFVTPTARLQTPGPLHPAPPPAPGGTKSPAPLKSVVVTVPASLRPGYELSLALTQIPAGRAADISVAQGTAVQATLAWRETATGFGGTLTTTAQRKDVVPWMAHEQLKDPVDVYNLEDGKNLHIEGTLEGLALQRLARSFAEIVQMRGPVVHVYPVTVPNPSKNTRPGDTVGVARDGFLVAEVLVGSVTSRDVTGNVLWGTHTWQKNDSTILER
jgi:metalloprotease